MTKSLSILCTLFILGACSTTPSPTTPPPAIEKQFLEKIVDKTLTTLDGTNRTIADNGEITTSGITYKFVEAINKNNGLYLLTLLGNPTPQYAAIRVDGTMVGLSQYYPTAEETKKLQFLHRLEN